MARALHGRLTYANVTATLALFVALGGGAYAASGGLISSSGLVQECVSAHGGVPRVVRAHARCGHGTIPLFLATPGATALRGLRGKRGATGPRGQTGATGPQGPAGATGPPSPSGGYAFSLGPSAASVDQTSGAKFAGNELRLACASGKCGAQVLVSGAWRAIGIDSRGNVNGAPATKMTVSTTPAQATLTEIEGAGGEHVSEGTATVSLLNGSAWHVDVVLTNDSAGNVSLWGTAVPGNATTPFAICAPGVAVAPPC